MSLALLIKGVLAGVAVSAPLGPIGILCIQNSLQKGWTGSLSMGLGMALADTLFAAAAGFGIQQFVTTLSQYAVPLRLLGSVLICLLAWQILRIHPMRSFRQAIHTPRHIWKDIIGAFLVTASNPITLLFFGGMFAGLIPSAASTDTIFFVLGVFIGAMSWWVLLGSIVARLKHQFRMRHIFWVNRITGSLVLLLGLLGVASVFYAP